MFLLFYIIAGASWTSRGLLIVGTYDFGICGVPWWICEGKHVHNSRVGEGFVVGFLMVILVKEMSLLTR